MLERGRRDELRLVFIMLWLFKSFGLNKYYFKGGAKWKVIDGALKSALKIGNVASTYHQNINTT